MKLTQLRDLVAIVEHGSLRAAARQLDIAQPLLTRSVRALEKDLGVILFDRQALGMTLTPAGKVFHQRACVIVNEARRARDELTQVLGEGQGTLVAGLSIMPHAGLLPGALPGFRRRYPNVRLQLIEGLFPDLESRLREGSVDFYMGAAPRLMPAPGLVVETLFHNTRAVVGRKGHPLSQAGSLKELAGADWATTSIDYNASEDLVRLFGRYDLPPPKVALQAGSALSLMVALAQTDLLAMLPRQWGDFPLTADALQVIPVREVLPAPDIVLIRRPDLPLTPAGEHLVDLMLRFAPVEPAESASIASVSMPL
ncbi:LysR substrate-binding domain-containing protein [Aquabacterium sp.]|jgi:LysR family transcriptional regulator of abg operon|uniref:LysR substrate-binding domain-containing protein n=1 Tax=Aquabacterium sp. TaxID=1872578 RepID=UPI0025BC623C|nr:LysR substrate-binding domain-containing protein [Aquabacterium sp.]